METKDVVMSFVLPPQFLSESWKESLFSQMKASLEGTCSLEYGSIIRLKRIRSVLNQKITNRTGHVWFLMVVETQFLLPKEEKIMYAPIDMIFDHGVFASLPNIKILVPVSVMNKDYRFCPLQKTFVPLRPTVPRLFTGKTESFRIRTVKFEGKQFSCLAELLEADHPGKLVTGSTDMAGTV